MTPVAESVRREADIPVAIARSMGAPEVADDGILDQSRSGGDWAGNLGQSALPYLQ